MMRGVVGLVMFGLVGLSGCGGGPIGGYWLGSLRCEDFRFEFEMTLEKDSGKAYVGTGTQSREFTSADGSSTSVLIEFDAALELSEGKGAQTVDVELTCTFEDQVRYPPGGGDPETISEGCTPRRFNGYTGSWDGEDRLLIDGPDGCTGELIRRGT